MRRHRRLRRCVVCSPAAADGVSSPPADEPTCREASAAAGIDLPRAGSTSPSRPTTPWPPPRSFSVSARSSRTSSKLFGRYEIGTRGRRTILHRIAQLNAAAGRTPL